MMSHSIKNLRLAMLFSLVYVCVDWLSFIHPMGQLNITPWNPPAAVQVLFLTWAGLMWAPWLFITIGFADWLIRDSIIFSSSVLIGNAILIGCYASISYLLIKLMKGVPRLQNRVEVFKLSLVSLIGAAITAILYVGLQTLIGKLVKDDFLEASYRFFVGDLLGLIVVLPLSLLFLNPFRREQFKQMFLSYSFWLLFFGLLICEYFVFSLPIELQMKYFFPLFFAVGLIGAAHSLPGATLSAAVVQIPLVISFTQVGVLPSDLIDMQIVMFTLSMTGLIIGTVVDERLNTQEKLKETLQLVAAGELAGSLAHELHQPMSAINAYAESALLLSSIENNEVNQKNKDRLRLTLDQIIKESIRASEIVRGLRSFFIGGTSNIKEAEVERLVTDTVFQLENFAQKLNVQIKVEKLKEPVSVMVDITQVKTALGNVIKNAIESANSNGVVEVMFAFDKQQRIEISIFDSGKTLDTYESEIIFKPFYSDKKDGLGLGLSISKSLIENNDGLITYRSNPRKCFVVSLPTGNKIDV
jgi:signal transduction histidine kinase